MWRGLETRKIIGGDEPAALPRLFVALWLPGPLAEAALARLEELRAGGRGVRWVRREQLHVTLKFLGETRVEAVPEIEAALAGVAAGSRPFRMGLRPGGVFPPSGPPRVVWLGVAPGEELRDMAARVERALLPLGFSPERRSFRPHLTLGRAGPGAAVDPAVLARDFTVAPAEVGSLSLVQSELRPAGAIYRDAARWELGAGLGGGALGPL